MARIFFFGRIGPMTSHALHSQKKNIVNPVALIILDGWGYREEAKDNAVLAARKPFFDKLWKDYPHTLLEASGLDVGLPQGQMGNSEIGHTTIGAGTVIDTDLVRIGKAITTGDFERNPAFVKLFEHVRRHGSTLHIMGLLSDGGVHSHADHLYAFLRAAKKSGIAKVAIHAFTDGRDVSPQSAGGYLKDLERVLAEVGIGRIVTITGRAFAMDRDNNWDRIALATDAIFAGTAPHTLPQQASLAPSMVVEDLYKKNALDEHMKPIVFLDERHKAWTIGKDDGVFFFNFRSDRARQISKKLVEKRADLNLCFVTLTQYDSTLEALVAFPPIAIETTLAAEIAKAHMTQAHIAETEKFPHATYFLNGGREKPHEGEQHILLESNKVATHDLAPKMRAEGIATAAVKAIEEGVQFIFINFANPDMVGHTANVPAIIEAIEEVDMQLKRVIEALTKKGGVAFVTADHGNAEVNIDPVTGKKHTAHTINPVPAIITKKDITVVRGGLADIAPTILALLGIAKPKAMTGKNLIS
jgi:2,3-bisphosphoglycerate-independent phosphoglycerate mutase